MRMRDLCSDERPREKMESKGCAALSNAELIAILLRTGTSKKNVLDLSREILSLCEGNLSMLSNLSIDELCRIEGVGKAKAISLSAAFELGRRSLSHNISKNIVITGPSSAVQAIGGNLRNLDHEECWILFLNRANKVIGKERITSGSMYATIIDAQIIVRKALEKRASGIIMFHNHPSGNVNPSSADIKETEKLKKALQTLGVSLMDHIIIGEDSYFSFSDSNVTFF